MRPSTFLFVVLAVTPFSAVTAQEPPPVKVGPQPDSVIIVEIKFREELEVQLEAGEMWTGLGQSLDSVNTILKAYGNPEIKPLIEEGVNDIVERDGSRLASWYRLSVKATASVDSFVARLNALAVVDTAYIAPTPVLPPLPG